LQEPLNDGNADRIRRTVIDRGRHADRFACDDHARTFGA
jgi:hypothetical protein